jgi:hypothetical protein
VCFLSTTHRTVVIFITNRDFCTSSSHNNRLWDNNSTPRLPRSIQQDYICSTISIFTLIIISRNAKLKHKRTRFLILCWLEPDSVSFNWKTTQSFKLVNKRLISKTEKCTLNFVEKHRNVPRYNAYTQATWPTRSSYILGAIYVVKKAWCFPTSPLTPDISYANQIIDNRLECNKFHQLHIQFI